MSTALAAPVPTTSVTMEKVLLHGDLAKLTPDERLSYYNAVCTSVGLNPLTQPFAYIQLNGKLTLYARKDCTDQLRNLHGVSIIALDENERDGVYVVTAKAQNAAGRIDMAKGAVSLGSLKGEALANAIMKAETKAKRRVTLSICGLGFLDETETDSIPGAGRPQFAETVTESGNGYTSELTAVTETAYITPEMRKKLGETAKARNIPTEIASSIVKQFGFDKTQDITADKYNEVLTALCDWKAPEPPSCVGSCLDCPTQYGGTCPETAPQSVENEMAALAAKHVDLDERPKAPPDPQVSEKARLAEKREEIDSLGQRLLNEGVPMKSIQSVMESKTLARESKNIKDVNDANACIVAMETLLEQAQKAKTARRKS